MLPLIDTFTGRMKKVGFGSFKDMSPPLQTGGYGVARRFFTAADRPFPLMQLGPGIFATNESSMYEWRAFKQLVIVGLRALIDSYPKLGFFSLEPIQFELRYIDVFDKSLLGKAALFDFLERGTSVQLQLPKILDDRKLFSGDPEGRFIFSRHLKGEKSSRFTLDIGSGVRDSKEIVRMESRIRREEAGTPVRGAPAKFFNDVSDWLEFAHGVTSPFFKEFILPNVMKKFAET